MILRTCLDDDFEHARRRAVGRGRELRDRGADTPDLVADEAGAESVEAEGDDEEVADADGDFCEDRCYDVALGL